MDKVQKIREEVARLQKRAEHNFDISLTENERQFWLCESNVLTLIRKYIDTVQEEPQVKESTKTQHINETCKENGDSLTKEPVREELEEAAKLHVIETRGKDVVWDENARCAMLDFKAGAKWQKENFWKPADGDDLTVIDREVIALLDNGKVVFAHRPPEYWDGKNIITGKVTRNYPKTYGKGGWNIPNVKYWLDYNIDSIIKED